MLKSNGEKRLGRWIFATLVTVSFLYIASPLLLPIAMGGVIAALFFPWLERLKRWKVSIRLGSAILTTGITLVLLIPASLLIFFVAKTGFQQIQSWRQATGNAGGFFDSFLTLPRVQYLMHWITNHIPISMAELTGTFQDLAISVGSKLAELLGGVFSHLPGMMMALAVIVLSVYFFLVDGHKLIHFFRRYSFFLPHQTEALIVSLQGMCRSVILASLVSGFGQAVLESVACAITATPNVALIGSLVFVASFIPVLGSFPVTLGVAIGQFIEGRQVAGGVLLGAAIIISGVDNMIRPMFLKGAADLHPLVAFIAALGGLQTLGFFGVFLGPVAAALFLSVTQILTEEGSVEEGD